MSASLEVFVDDANGVESVGLVLRDASIVEYEDELAPACLMTAGQARALAGALGRCADRIEGGQ
jgi:hypothetical protein